MFTCCCSCSILFVFCLHLVHITRFGLAFTLYKECSIFYVRYMHFSMYVRAVLVAVFFTHISKVSSHSHGDHECIVDIFC
uniref:Uncharacterized protein n=1 Tax=Rhipicephalus microplus TaxID=6941 RepID=A0A6M2DC90_RHIMP